MLRPKKLLPIVQMNKLLTLFLLTFTLFAQILYSSNLSDDFKRFEKTIHIAISRIEFVLGADKDETTALNDLILRHIELAAIANDCISQNEEGFYNLAIYLVASKFRQSKLAHEALKHELELNNYPPLKQWLRSRVVALEKGDIPMTDVSSELKTITKTLNLRP